jgi:hypothetical protein
MIRSLTLIVLGAASLGAPATLAAQPAGRPYPAFVPRAFVMFSQQQFAAKETFEAIFGQSTGPFRGLGTDVVLARNVFVEFGFARFQDTGERVFRSGGETFHLGIPLTAKIRSIDFTAGYRYTRWRSIIPYAGVGAGNYRYEENSDFAAAGDDVSVSGSGVVLIAGVEARVARLFGISVDVHRSTIENIIGGGGISQEFGEDNLGGTAARFRIIIGR